MVAGKLGILAGGGPVPRQIVESCRQEAREVFVLAFEGQTDIQTTSDTDHAWVRLGAVGAAIELLREARVEDVVLAGPIRRPSMAELRPDAKAMAALARAGASAFGDDGMLRLIIKTLEKEGFGVVGIDDLLDSVTVGDGPIGNLAPDDTARRDIARGAEVLRAMGSVDVGQAVIVQEGIVLGVEAAEGTDGLITRCAELKRGGAGGVLVKLSKPGQENRADLPSIGPVTVQGAHRAGLRGIALEAGASLILSRDETVREANRLGVFLIGISVPK